MIKNWKVVTASVISLGLILLNSSSGQIGGPDRTSLYIQEGDVFEYMFSAVNLSEDLQEEYFADYGVLPEVGTVTARYEIIAVDPITGDLSYVVDYWTGNHDDIETSLLNNNANFKYRDWDYWNSIHANISDYDVSSLAERDLRSHVYDSSETYTVGFVRLFSHIEHENWTGPARTYRFSENVWDKATGVIIHTSTNRTTHYFNGTMSGYHMEARLTTELHPELRRSVSEDNKNPLPVNFHSIMLAIFVSSTSKLFKGRKKRNHKD